ncbi:hypothetical protein BX283_1614 [Streptomyces sp. TLI_146]|nr:hypothetical protein BX283_1614 [Streptomyces sp. TLI_146]
MRDAQQFMTAVIRMAAAAGVLTVLHPLMLALLVLAVLPAGAGAVMAARVDYETHCANVGDRNVRGMMRWWATTPKLADEVAAERRGGQGDPQQPGAWLAVTGRVELGVAASAVVAVQSSLSALSQVVVYGAAMFHTSLYLADMRTSLDFAAERAPKRGRLTAQCGGAAAGA